MNIKQPKQCFSCGAIGYTLNKPSVFVYMCKENGEVISTEIVEKSGGDIRCSECNMQLGVLSTTDNSVWWSGFERHKRNNPTA